MRRYSCQHLKIPISNIVREGVREGASLIFQLEIVLSGAYWIVSFSTFFSPQHVFLCIWVCVHCTYALTCNVSMYCPPEWVREYAMHKCTLHCTVSMHVCVRWVCTKHIEHNICKFNGYIRIFVMRSKICNDYNFFGVSWQLCEGSP